MGKVIGLFVVAATLFAATAALAGPYLETFNLGSAGWQAPTVNNGGGVTLPNTLFNAAGGNGGGYISATLTLGPDRPFGLQPADAHLFQDLAGLTLTTDYKIDGQVTGPANAMVRFYVGTYTGGNNYFVSADAFSWNPNADQAWTTHTVALAASNFQVWPNQGSYNRTFDQVIAAPEDIGLVFCGNFTTNSTLGVSGSGTVMVDNFGATRAEGAIPEPASLAVLGLGAAGLLLQRHSRRAQRAAVRPRT
jgi:hypothetical protein